MTLVERLLREAARRGLRQAEICVTPATAAPVSGWRSDLARLHGVDVRLVEVVDSAAAYRRLAEASGPTLVLEGDVVVDDRVLDHLLDAGPDVVVTGDNAAAAYVSAAGAARLGAQSGLADAAVDGAARRIDIATLGHYVPELRLTMAPFLIRLMEPGQLRQVDRLMFHRTFKGVIDAVARYGYYHFVRFTTRWLSRTTVSPNLLTLLSILGIWAAVPCFATGHLGWGIASAWLGVILDSVDGKLARLTVNLSDAMGALEHAAAMPGLGLWFVVLGWHLSDGRPFAVTPTTVAGATLVGTFLLDKVLSGSYKALFGHELFDARRLDAVFHLVAARRNIHLLILSFGVVLDAVHAAYQVMAAAMAVTLLVHGLRFVWLAATRGRPAGA
jgi:hypothetical protein